jgi:hypothetical protein
MEDQRYAVTYLNNLCTLYHLSGDSPTWHDFWEFYNTKNRLTAKPDLDNYISEQCSYIAKALVILGKDHFITNQFLSRLPLKHSKTILSWPPTPEQIKELMTD